MPCPYFEPRRVVAAPQYLNVRLPLIQEYDGFCHAGPEHCAAPSELRFRCCNHGYSRRACPRLPAAEVASGLRYDVLRRSGAELEVMYIEEQNYAPRSWRAVHYSLEDERLEPEITDVCARAQLLAFCRSYLRSFPG